MQDGEAVNRRHPAGRQKLKQLEQVGCDQGEEFRPEAQKKAKK